MDFNTTNIKILLSARSVYENAMILQHNKPELKTKINQDLFFALNKFGFIDFQNFKFINASFNMLEFDDCYRVRHKDKPLTIDPPLMDITDFCVAGSGCIKRGYPPCAHETNKEFVRCYNNDNTVKFLDYKDSKICQEHYQIAESLKIDTSKLYVPHPIGLIGCYYNNPETMTPIYCEGRTIKIKEPNFDVFWGMERYFSMANTENQIRKSIYENANTNL